MTAKVVPAHVLHELGEIADAGQAADDDRGRWRARRATVPTAIRTSGSQPDWDPTHVWMHVVHRHQGGAFKLDGGAQSESDVTQLSKRLAGVGLLRPTSRQQAESASSDRDTGINYYKFTITGKVAY